MNTTLKITRYDADLNPRFGAEGEKRWIVRQHVTHTINGVEQLPRWTVVKVYANKASAEKYAARENAALKAAQPVDPTVVPRWQSRAVAATKDTRLGAILRCALGRNITGALPQFSGFATITSDGFVMCNFTDSQGRDHTGVFVGSYSDLDLNIEGLAKHLSFDSDEYKALRAAIANWIGKDWSK